MEAIIETQATGSLNQEVSEPWKKDWNDPVVDVTPPANTNPQVVIPVSSESPWEKSWGSNSVPNAPRQVPVASKTSSGEWDSINSKYAQGADKRSQSQLEILQQELATEKRPQFIASLKREISRVQGK